MLHHQTPIITRQTALTAGFVGYAALPFETAHRLAPLRRRGPELGFEQIVLGHGHVVERYGRHILRDAYAFLRSYRSGMGIPQAMPMNGLAQ